MALSFDWFGWNEPAIEILTVVDELELLEAFAVPPASADCANALRSILSIFAFSWFYKNKGR